MNRLGFALSVLAVVASAAWAYHVNYRTKTALNKVEKLRSQIAAEREAHEVLRVEWAFLTAPDRLAWLVEENNDLLALVPMGPQGLDDVAAIPYPPRNATPAELSLEREAEMILIISEKVPLVTGNVPMPTPKPAAWKRQ